MKKEEITKKIANAKIIIRWKNKPDIDNFFYIKEENGLIKYSRYGEVNKTDDVTIDYTNVI